MYKIIFPIVHILNDLIIVVVGGSLPRLFISDIHVQLNIRFILQYTFYVDIIIKYFHTYNFNLV